jgi:hypothetical protein
VKAGHSGDVLKQGINRHALTRYTSRSIQTLEALPRAEAMASAIIFGLPWEIVLEASINADGPPEGGTANRGYAVQFA